MPTSRSYQDACGVARALDVIGERWALLVVRELLFGPRRFVDIRRSLGRASSNMVTDRLRELVANGVVIRRELPAPIRAQVYELTDRGRALEPVIDAIGAWGIEVGLPMGTTTLTAASALLALRTFTSPGDKLEGFVCRIDMDSESWAVAVRDGTVQVTPGGSSDADTVVATTPAALMNACDAADPLAVDDLSVVGPTTQLAELLRSANIPRPVLASMVPLPVAHR